MKQYKSSNVGAQWTAFVVADKKYFSCINTKQMVVNLSDNYRLVISKPRFRSCGLLAE